jgi:hypothetical protein
MRSPKEAFSNREIETELMSDEDAQVQVEATENNPLHIGK